MAVTVTSDNQTFTGAIFHALPSILSGNRVVNSVQLYRVLCERVLYQETATLISIQHVRVALIRMAKKRSPDLSLPNYIFPVPAGLFPKEFPGQVGYI